MSKKISRNGNGTSKVPHRSRIYSDLSGVYDHVFTRVFSRRIEHVLGNLGLKPGSVGLEVGIGTGLSLDAYPSHCRVTGIDLSAEMLEHARRKWDPRRHAHIELRQMDGMNLEYEDATFDFVTAFHVVTVVPDPKRLVDEMTRVCKPDGQVVIINHFSSRHAPVRMLVDMVDPVTRVLGWSTRLKLEEVIDDNTLALQQRYKTSPWSLFTVVEARKSGNGVASA